jgi:hypothetical protein
MGGAQMKKMFFLIVTLLLIAGWSLAATALHVVWTGDRPVVIPKDRLGLRDTYVNTSAWTADDVAAHPAVVKRLVATGKADVLAPAFKPAAGDELVTQINDAIARGPTTQPAPSAAEKALDKVEQAVDQAKAIVKN